MNLLKPKISLLLLILIYFFSSSCYRESIDCYVIDSSDVNCSYFGKFSIDTGNYYWFYDHPNTEFKFTNNNNFTAVFYSGQTSHKYLLKRLDSHSEYNDCGDGYSCYDTCFYEQYYLSLKSFDIPIRIEIILTKLFIHSRFYRSDPQKVPDQLYVKINDDIFPMIADTNLTLIYPEFNIEIIDSLSIRGHFYRNVLKSELISSGYYYTMDKILGCYYSTNEGLIGFFTKKGDLWLKN